MGRLSNNIRFHSNWLSYLGRKYFGSFSKGFTFKVRSGAQFQVPGRLMHPYKECFFDDTYFKGLPKTVAGRDIRTVIDVGANVGYFSLRVFAQFPDAQVYSFEPIPANFRLMDRYRNENPAFRWKVFNQAAGDQDGELALSYDAKDDFSTSATILPDSGQADQIRVQCVSLEGFIRDEELEQVDFLKLDCEGSEYPIVYSLSPEIWERIRIVSIETHPGSGKNENRDALAAYLRQQGFETAVERAQIWAWKPK